MNRNEELLKKACDSIGDRVFAIYDKSEYSIGPIITAMDEYAKEKTEPYKKIAELISEIFFYGNFKVETINESELEKRLIEMGLWPTSISDIDKRKDITL